MLSFMSALLLTLSESPNEPPITKHSFGLPEFSRSAMSFAMPSLGICLPSTHIAVTYASDGMAFRISCASLSSAADISALDGSSPSRCSVSSVSSKRQSVRRRFSYSAKASI